MKTNNKILIFLVVFGVILFGIFKGIVMPQMAQSKQLDTIEQQDPVKHNFESVLKYKNQYMGNASNLSNLFRSLPLSNIGVSFQLFPDTLTVDVNYKEAVDSIGEDKVNKALIYNATAAFALIDNLEAINFKFTGVSYKVLRSDVEKWFSVKLSTLAEKDTWKKTVQSKLDENEYVLNCTKAVLHKNSSN